MALTAEQTEKLNEAIDNLNRSVEINKEVLEVVKSVGNTGAVDLATHNTDKDAHSGGFNDLTATRSFTANVYATSTLSVRPDPTTINENTALGFTKIVYDSTDGVERTVMQMCGGYKGDNKTGTTALRFYTANEDMSNAFVDKELGTITFYSRSSTNSSYFNVANPQVALRAATNQAGDATLYVGLRDSASGTRQYYFNKDFFNCTTASDLGSSTFQWRDAYLQNSPIVSSDKRLKQDFSEVPEAVFIAWANVKFQQYRFKDAVAAKGDLARKHVGLVAQEIVEAFQAQGLDACDYGIVCHESWEDQYQDVEVSHTPAVTDANGKVVTPEKTEYEHRLVKPAGDVWTVRYEEALALEAAYQRWKLAKIEQALTAKGITL